VLGAGIEPQLTVVAASGVIVGRAAGLTVIILETGASVLPQASVAVHVSVTVPPHASGVVVNVERLDVPVIEQFPLSPLLKGSVEAVGIEPQATVTAVGAVITGNAAGETVITLDTGASVLPHASVAVHVSVTVPPQTPGAVVKVDRFEVPVIWQFPVSPLVKPILLGAGIPPQATVIACGAVMAGNAAGLTVMVLETGASILPHASVAVQVSVTVPPHGPGAVLNVEGFEVPLTAQLPVSPLLKGIVLGAGMDPQATVIVAGAVIVGNAAGLTVIVLVTGTSNLPQPSVAVHVSVIVPPQAPGAVENVD
jgi:hypothetical protein